jgi:phage tail sheath protein FI
LNPAEVRDQGQLIVEIGMAPVKPAEFVIFRISQWAGGAVGGA